MYLPGYVIERNTPQDDDSYADSALGTDHLYAASSSMFSTLFIRRKLTNC